MTVATGTATTLLGGVTIAANTQFTVALDPDTTNEEIRSEHTFIRLNMSAFERYSGNRW
jgi:hypothetical protein